MSITAITEAYSSIRDDEPRSVLKTLMTDERNISAIMGNRTGKLPEKTCCNRRSVKLSKFFAESASEAMFPASAADEISDMSGFSVSNPSTAEYISFSV